MKLPFSAAFLFSMFGMIKNISLLLCLPFWVTTSYSASFIPLGHLPNEINGSSVAYGVSADGAVVVGRSRSSAVPSRVEAFIGNIPDPITGIGVPSGALATTAQAASTHGAYIAGFAHYSGLDIEAFRWSQNGGYQMLGFLPNSSSNPVSIARDVSSDGSTVVGRSDSTVSSSFEAFRWTETNGIIGLGDLAGGGVSSEATGVSADGSIVVGRSQYTSSSNDEAFIWTEAAGMIGLGDFNVASGGWSTAYDVNSIGSHVVGFARSGSGFDAFLWTENSGLLSLGDLPGGERNSKAFGVSADGNVVVGDSSTGVNTPGGNEAFVWNSLDGMRSLKDVMESDYSIDLSGWVLRHAYGISDDGLTIVGEGVNPFGQDEAWAITLDATVPIPAAAWLFGTGLIGLVGVARRKAA